MFIFVLKADEDNRLLAERYDFLNISIRPK